MSFLDAFKNEILSSSSEERVEVNQRLLIDKILARYSSEFVIYRELIQNSDDAKSTSVQIIFETENHKKVENKVIKGLSTNRIIIGNKIEDKFTRVIFKNNGNAFNREDWNRLKTIAEGNPDEQKIGAFGVGFYSLFSICEEPFVSSGGQGMAFYWRKNQLVTKRGSIGDKSGGKAAASALGGSTHEKRIGGGAEGEAWTAFLMDTREPMKFPDVEHFARFLANSLGFTGNLREISVYFNDTLVIKLSKKMQMPKIMNVKPEFDTHSPQKMFHLTSVDVRDVQLDVMRLLIPTNIDARRLSIYRFQVEEASTFLSIASGNLDVKLSPEFSAEMERITKKKPPNKTTIQMIFAGFDEHRNYNKNISPVFKDLIPYPEQGKIHIGFSTHQTTGCCSHLAARVIPTVERESVDLVEKTLAIYNNEMLCLGGTLCRILYEDEMTQISHLYNTDTKADEENTKLFRDWLERWAAHALIHFSFRTSTPNAQVGKILESQFFNCSEKKLSILSTNGVLPISCVRIPNSEMEGFIKLVPIVPKTIFEQCEKFATNSLKLIEELTLSDVLRELNNRTLHDDEMVELLKWWISYRSKGNDVDSSELNQFMQFAHIGNRFRSLNTIRYFLNPGIVPLYMDVPIEVLPYTISKTLENNDLKKWFGWSELSLVNWAKFIINKPDLETDPKFAEEVHYILSKSLRNTSKSDKETIRQLFVKKGCVPTKFGMKIPNETYFQNVNLFPDIPTIQFQKPPRNFQSIMELLGVRKVIKLQLIFDHLDNRKDLDHMQLVKYLASNSRDLEENEIKILKNKPIWPKEVLENLVYIYSKYMPIQRFDARSLHTPIPIHRDLELPVIDWKGRWSRYTQEGKFLIDLGLREYPTLQKILELSAPPTNPIIRIKAFRYFIDNFNERYSKEYKSDEINIAFLPCSNPNICAKPSECFINPECITMEFKTVRQDLLFYAEQFGIRQNPSREKLLKRLIDNPPRDKNKAKEIFEYLASRQGDFNASDWKILADLKCIPIHDKTQPNLITLTNPNSCFFKNLGEGLDDFFTYINFGEKANKFLQCCGVKDEPTSIDLAELLVKSSCDLWNLINDEEKYMSMLKRIAVSYDQIAIIKPSLIVEMKRKPILLAIKKTFYHDTIDLASAKEIYINDNPMYQNLFNPLIAPEDELIETFYKNLGCKTLRKSVKETAIQKGIIKETENSRKLQDIIRGRARLFYHDISKRNVIRNYEWLKELNVKEIDHVETIHVLGNVTKITKDFTTACIHQNRQMDSWVLYVTSNPNYMDVSQYIGSSICKSPKLMEIYFFHMILTSSISSLKYSGFPVDRIFKPKSENVIKKYDQKQPVRKPIIVTPKSTESLRNSLQDIIKTCHSNFGSNINSQDNATIVNESQSSYCDIIPGHLLFFVGTRQGIELYDSKDINQSEILSQSNAEPLNRFINILKDIADVFKLTPQSIHVFYDNYSNSIAFNRDKALFFNLKFYIGLHDKEYTLHPTIDVMSYWYMTFCHELSHNSIKSHSSEHEYYLSSFAEIYMSNFLSLMKKRGTL